MKKIFVTLCFVAVSMLAGAQNCDIPMRVVVSDGIEGMTQSSAEYLKNVLRRVTTSGDDAISANSQFGIMVKSDVVNKHLISGAPQKTVLNLSMTLYIGDLQQGKLFSSYTVDVNGVGDNDTKAYNSAIRKLTAQNRKLVSFVEEGKAKIIEWYDNNYQNIIKQAQKASAVREYDKALYELFSVPVCCKGYDAVLAQIKIAYQQYIDKQCEENLAQAQAAWMTGFNSENASIAAGFLANIEPESSCYKEAVKLVNEIKRHMGEKWNFQMKQWDDLVSVESQKLANAHEIALAYAQNQPQVIIKPLY